MGQLTRSQDWSSTVLGPPDQWPLSLRITLGIILHSAFPMFLFWGPDRICFYNDAYRPSLGDNGKHPAVGKHGADVWPEIWDFIGPMIDQVMTTGEATFFEDQLIPIHRNGQLQDVYWTYSYSPAYDDDGRINGVFVATTETTRKVNSISRLQLSEQRFQSLVREASVGIVVLEGEDIWVSVVNDAYARLIGCRVEELEGNQLFSIIPEAEGVFRPIIDGVRLTGEPHYLYAQPYFVQVNGIRESGFLDLVYQPHKEPDGRITGVMILCQDVTQQVLNRQKTEESEARFRSLVEQAPVAITIFRGPNYIVELANEAHLLLWSRQAEDVLGKPLFEALPEAKGQGFEELLANVMTTGNPFVANELHAPLLRNGILETVYFNFVYQPLHEPDGTISGVIVVASDVTEQVLARQRVEESELRFKSLIYEAPVATCLFLGPEMRIDVANELMINFFGQGSSILGKPIRDVLTTANDHSALQLLDQVFTTGVPFYAKGAPAELTIEGVRDTYYFDFSLKPLHNEAGAVYAILETAVDVTAEIRSKQALALSETHFRRLTDTVPAKIWSTRPDGYCTYLNKQWYDFTGQTPEQAEGFGWLDATHPDDRETAGQLFIEANKRQHSFNAVYRLRRKDGAYRWSIDTGSPHFDEHGTYEGMIGTVVDIHDQKLAEEEKQKLVSIVEASHEFIGMANIDSTILYFNPAALSMLGWDSVDGRCLQDCIYPPDRDLAQKLVKELLETGRFSNEIRLMNERTGEPFWLQWNGVTIKEEHSGNIIALATVSPNITDRRKAEQDLKESEERFQVAVAAVQGILWTNNAVGEMAGQQPGWAALTGQTYEEYQGYGWTKAVHPDDAQSTLDAWEIAVAGRQMFITEHRLRVYDGSWRLFSVRAIPLLDTMGAVREWVGVHTDITEQRRSTEALAESEARFRKLSGELDKQVQRRTEQLQNSILDLQRSNANLQQFAYVASHDLQEPLRKIQSFGDLLKSQYGNQLGNGVDHLERMQSAAGRMSTLIRDLLTYSRISTQQTTTALVSLTTVVTTALADLDLVIEASGALVRVDDLPTVPGDALQLGQLFQNLLSNALKFSRAEQQPQIRVSCRAVAATTLPPAIKPIRQAAAYYRIDVSDNGIGFDEKYLDRIFQVFQRLNTKSQYAGTGIGLAICEKVAANHGGAITASSQPGQGATFSIYLPQ